MLAKYWKKIGLFILIFACLWNITSKFVKRMSFNDSLKSTIKSKTEEILNKDNNEDDEEENSQTTNNNYNKQQENVRENNQNYYQNNNGNNQNQQNYQENQ
ncbi:MAG: hypothetical protein IKG42_05075 [Clostridia bacterium]|nr:hypothetical protein [Clostridia bacterium]